MDSRLMQPICPEFSIGFLFRSQIGLSLQRRLPKSGFKNINRIEYVGINLDTLQKLADSKKITKFDLDAFYKNGLIQKKDRVKILGRGELTSALEVTVHAYTATAKEGIEKAGGKAETI